MPSCWLWLSYPCTCTGILVPDQGLETRWRSKIARRLRMRCDLANCCHVAPITSGCGTGNRINWFCGRKFEDDVGMSRLVIQRKELGPFLHLCRHLCNLSSIPPNILARNPSRDHTSAPDTQHQASLYSSQPPLKMGAVVSCLQSICQTIGSVLVCHIYSALHDPG